jgi:hypothetical protein
VKRWTTDLTEVLLNGVGAGFNAGAAERKFGFPLRNLRLSAHAPA